MNYFDALFNQLAAGYWAAWSYVTLLAVLIIAMLVQSHFVRRTAQTIGEGAMIPISFVSNLIVDLLVKFVALLFGLVYIFIPKKRR